MEEKIDLIKIIAKIFKCVKYYWWMLVVCVVVCGFALGFKEVRSYNPTYQSSATFIVQANSGQSSSSYTDRLAANQIVQIFPYILRSGELSQMVANDLGLASIPGKISVKSLNTTPIFTVTVTAKTPELAKEFLDSVLDNYPQVAEYIIGNTTMIPMDETGIVETPINQIDIVGSVSKGAFIGFMMAFCIIIVLALSRKTVDSKNDLKNVTSLKCLSTIPTVIFKKRKVKELVLISNKKTGHGFQEAMRTVGIRLEHYIRKENEKLDTNKKVILITSTLPGEGKSTMSCNMAIALAGRKNKVILIDCDLRNPSIASTMGFDQSEKGFREVLMGDVQLKDVIHQVPDSTLDIIAGGKPTNLASEILSNPKMKTVMEQLREQYDYIILDCAPIGMLSDAMMLIQQADVGLFVVKQDYAPVKRVLESIETLTSRGLDLVGYVINGAENVTSRYGSYYGGYYGKYGSYYSSKYNKKEE